MKSGQILILILLIVVVVLTVGLSVASRNITNLRTSTQTEQSQRAFTAAEGGIEHVLSNLAEAAVSGNLDVPVGDITAKVSVEASNIYERVINLGDVGQIDLSGASGLVQIEWAKKTNPLEVSPTPDAPASIEVTQVYGSNLQERYYFQGLASRPGESGQFTNGTTCFSADFEKCVQISLLPSAKILRIKPFWLRTTVKVSGVSGTTLPQQTYDVTSTASTEIGVTRRVQVTRTALPQLPAVFDYVLYSEEGIVK